MELLILLAIILAFAMGRASKPSHNIRLFNAQLEATEKTGYRLARIRVGPGLDDVLLALHRIEGMQGAMRDNMDDVKQRVNDFGAQTENTNASE